MPEHLSAMVWTLRKCVVHATTSNLHRTFREEWPKRSGIHTTSFSHSGPELGASKLKPVSPSGFDTHSGRWGLVQQHCTIAKQIEFRRADDVRNLSGEDEESYWVSVVFCGRQDGRLPTRQSYLQC